jgi:hypothetical protein
MRRLKVTPAAKTPASPRPPEEAAADCSLATAPTAPGGAGGCRLRLAPFLTAEWCYVGSRAWSMEHQEFLPRAVARFHGRRRSGLCKGPRQRSAARGGAKGRPAPSRPRRVGRCHDGADPATANQDTFLDAATLASKKPSEARPECKNDRAHASALKFPGFTVAKHPGCDPRFLWAKRSREAYRRLSGRPLISKQAAS